MSNIRPYTYLIKCKSTNQFYYGTRFKNVQLGLEPKDDLMVKYFTSCKPLNALIDQHGLDNFEWEVRKTFDSADAAIEWEKKVLRRCKVLYDPKWLNQNIAGYIVPTPEGLKKISERHKGVPKDESHRGNISKALKGKVRSAKHCENIRLNRVDFWGEKNPMFGKSQKQSTKDKIGAKNSGRPKTPEELEKLIAGSSNRTTVNNGSINKNVKHDELDNYLADGWVIGRLLSEATKKLISENTKNFHTGKKRSEATKKKQSESAMGKKKTAEHCKNMSLSKKGIPNLKAAKGERCAKAKLTAEQVLEIRDKFARGVAKKRELSREYGVSDVTIHHIILRNYWKHI